MPGDARAALGLELFLSVGALGGGAALLLGPRGEVMPVDLRLLLRSPFADYFWPGAILFTVLGLGPLIAARLIWVRNRWAPAATAAVGVVLLGWTAVEIAMIGFTLQPPLQPFYLALGLALIAIGWLGARRAPLRA